MVDETTAPALFEDRKKEKSNERGDRDDRDRRGGADGRRSSNDRDRDRDREDEARERRKRRNPPVSNPEEQAAFEEARERERENERCRKAEEAEEQKRAAERQRQMHMESLVNFVAFNRYKQQRRFLVDEHDGAPPPPRHRPPNAKPVAPTPQAQCVTVAAGERTNAEAQMVLKGALGAGAKRVAVARCLYFQLSDLDVEISPATFEYMVVSMCAGGRHFCGQRFFNAYGRLRTCSWK